MEANGYVTRRRIRNIKGQLQEIEYTIHENPVEQTPGNTPLTPKREIPVLDNPVLEKPKQVNPAQLNTDISNKETLNNDVLSTHQSIYPADTSGQLDPKPKTTGRPYGGMDRMDGIDPIEIYRKLIKDSIAYDILCSRYDPERMTEILELILETVCSTKKTITIGGTPFPAEVVKSRFLKINQLHIEYVFECIDKNTTKIRNIKSYLLTVLYNAPATMEHYYTAEVNHDLYGGGD